MEVAIPGESKFEQCRILQFHNFFYPEHETLRFKKKKEMN